MSPLPSPNLLNDHLIDLCRELLAERRLIIMSNKGPVEYHIRDDNTLRLNQGTGSVVPALSAISKYIELTWIASAMGEGDRHVAACHNGRFQVQLPGQKLYLRFVSSPRNIYHKYYNLLCNPLIWFLQHYMWNSPFTPTIDAKVYDAWENGYVAVNRSFAEAAIDEAANDRVPPFIMIHDYQLYLAGSYIRHQMPQAILQHFIQVPWPAPTYWQLFPTSMRRAILESLCAVDIVGLQTKRDTHQFLHSCEIFLDEAEVDYREHIVTFRGHQTRVAAYPVSVDVDSLERLTRSLRVRDSERKLRPHLGKQTIVRVDRAEPNKNIIRGLKAFDILLERYPDLVKQVKLLCFLMPSRSGIKQYQKYTQDTFELIEAINVKYRDGEWQPVEIFFENDHAQAIAGMRLCDVLLVNPVIDGMGLVAKEGPIVTANDSVLILSETAGAHEQLKDYVVSVSPADVEGTAQALHQALMMDPVERKKRAEGLRKAIAQEDITRWLCHQFQDMRELACQLPLLLPV